MQIAAFLEPVRRALTEHLKSNLDAPTTELELAAL